MGRKSYTREFKSEAIDLANRKGPSEASRQLGVSISNIQRWQLQSKKKTTPTPVSEVNLEKENRKLRQEIEYLRKINEVLKKSTAIFSQDHHPNSK